MRIRNEAIRGHIFLFFFFETRYSTLYINILSDNRYTYVYIFLFIANSRRILYLITDKKKKDAF